MGPGLGLSGAGGLGTEDVEVAVLAGFGDGVGWIAAVDVAGHADDEVGNGDFVVCELGREGGVAKAKPADGEVRGREGGREVTERLIEAVRGDRGTDGRALFRFPH